MRSLYITHYYVQGTDPWKNIMLAPYGYVEAQLWYRPGQ